MLTLPKKCILRSRKDIETLLSGGETFFRHPIKAYVLKTSDIGFSRMMVSVPKRHFKLAVSRNLLKRRIREAFRLNRECLGDAQVDILFVYLGKEIADYDVISSRVMEILSLAAPKDQDGGSIPADPAR